MTVSETDETPANPAERIDDSRDVPVVVNFLRKSAHSARGEIEHFHDLNPLLSEGAERREHGQGSQSANSEVSFFHRFSFSPLVRLNFFGFVLTQRSSCPAEAM